VVFFTKNNPIIKGNFFIDSRKCFIIIYNIILND
jgi:hypothetical protein